MSEEFEFDGVIVEIGLLGLQIRFHDERELWKLARMVERKRNVHVKLKILGDGETYDKEMEETRERARFAVERLEKQRVEDSKRAEQVIHESNEIMEKARKKLE